MTDGPGVNNPTIGKYIPPSTGCIRDTYLRR